MNSPRSPKKALLPSEPPEVSPLGLAHAIRYHRKKSGLSQSGLAALAGVGKTVVFDLEKNKPSVRLDTLLKVLRVLNIGVFFRSPLMGTFLSERGK